MTVVLQPTIYTIISVILQLNEVCKAGVSYNTLLWVRDGK